MLTLPTKVEEPSYTWIELGDKFKWKDESKIKFQEALRPPRILQLAEECEQYLDAGLVEPASDKIINMYLEAAKLSLEVKKSPKTSSHSNAFKHKKKWKKWFDTDCKNHKNITRRLAIMKHQQPNNLQLRAKHNEELKKYKTVCNKKKREFEKKQVDKLSELAAEPDKFWKHYKQVDDNVRKEDMSKVDGQKWEKYFSKLYDDPTRPNLNPTSPPSD